ncbi:MAG: hypothetical protein HDR07_01715 [Lachnospiraceae bacterium]|nr:hypothetical protein [Lachnospiraceae bacterium]
MKKIRSGMKLLYISLLFVCICVLVCTFLYEKSKTDPDTENDDILDANEVSDREAENSEETELTQEEIVEEIISELVCKRLREVDFTIKEYPIDTEVYTEEMDREYKEVFLQVLLNQIPVQYEDGEGTYFEDIDTDKEKLNTDNITMIKEFFVYCYLDFDGDGLPELIVDPCGNYVRFGGPRIFKYDRDSKKVYVDGYRFMRYRPLCAGKFYYENKGLAGSIRYGYQEIDSQGNVVEEVLFQLAYPSSYHPSERYIIGSVGEFTHVGVEIDKESGDEILHDFFEAKDNAVTGITFDELFSDIEHP